MTVRTWRHGWPFEASLISKPYLLSAYCILHIDASTLKKSQSFTVCHHRGKRTASRKIEWVTTKSAIQPLWALPYIVEMQSQSIERAEDEIEIPQDKGNGWKIPCGCWLVGVPQGKIGLLQRWGDVVSDSLYSFIRWIVVDLNLNHFCFPETVLESFKRSFTLALFACSSVAKTFE